MRLLVIIAALCGLLLSGSVQAAEYTFYSDLGDGYLRKIDAAIGTACTGPGGPITSGITARCGEYWTGAVYHVDKAYFRWIITGVGGGETITDAQMSLYIVGKGSAALIGLRPTIIDDFSPLDSGDWTATGTNLSAISYPDIDVGTYETWDVTSYVTTDDTLAVVLWTVGQCDGTDPIADDRVTINTANQGGDQRPRLVLTTIGGARRTIPGAIVTHDGNINPLVKVRPTR